MIKVSIPISLRWGPKRHELVAATAEQLLSEKAKIKVQEILSPLGNATLMSISTWADQIKGSNPGDPDSIQFLKDFPDKGVEWHFVDLPLEVNEYSRQNYPMFTRDNDIVQMLTKSISVILGQSAIMSKMNALRWITHLTGDIHQPIHVGCGYIDYSSQTPKLTFDPAVIIKEGFKSDRGGNALILPLKTDAKKLNLHSYWDSSLPGSDVGLGDELKQSDDEICEMEIDLINQFLININARQSNKKNLGTIQEWPAAWATDTLFAAREAYKTIKIESKINDKEFNVSWEGKVAYENRCGPIVSKRIQLAAQRLAEILNTILG